MSHALAGKIAVEGIFYAGIGFAVAVSTFWPWWKSQLGWSVTIKALAFSVATLPTMIMYWFGVRAPAWLLWAAIYALWLVPPILAWRAVVIWHAQRRVRDII